LSTLAEIIDERMMLEICSNVALLVSVRIERVKKEDTYLKNIVFRTIEFVI